MTVATAILLSTIIVTALMVYRWRTAPRSAQLGRRRDFSKLWAGAFLLFLVWASYGSLTAEVIKGWPERGQFGDMFGALNALFTALAFAALIFTVSLQLDELALQREELSETRKEMAGQREQLEHQSTHFERQNFEAQLNTLVNLHTTIVQSCEDYVQVGPIGNQRDQVVRGRQYFQTIVADSGGLYRQMRRSVHGPLSRQVRLTEQHNVPQVFWKTAFAELGSDQVLALVLVAYSGFYEKHRADLSHYYRNLYRAFYIIDRADLRLRTQRNYASIVRAQLSDYELGLLFINGLSPAGARMKPLIETFSLLNNASDDLLLAGEGRVWYRENAFAQSPLVFDDETVVEPPADAPMRRPKW